MKEYMLFLDESKSNNTHPYFCLGGCIIESEYYKEKIIPFVEHIKYDLWKDKSINLHESDIRDAKKDRYTIMNKSINRDRFWNYMRELFDVFEFKIISVVYNSDFKDVYNNEYLNDEYFSCLQIILENYAHFLEQNKAIGRVYIESQDIGSDNRLKAHYFNLMANGTLFLKALNLQNHIMNIYFHGKQDNIVGLQIADFIPNAIKRYSNGKNQKNPNILPNILKHIYDGGIDDTSRFGIKKFGK